MISVSKLYCGGTAESDGLRYGHGGQGPVLSADASAKLLIEGNCDERGTQEYNRSLGERRALAAREALAKMGIDPSRVRTISYGKDKPVDPDNNEAAWAKNRRDDFVLLHPKAGA